MRWLPPRRAPGDAVPADERTCFRRGHHPLGFVSSQVAEMRSPLCTQRQQFCGQPLNQTWRTQLMKSCEVTVMSVVSVVELASTPGQQFDW